MEFNIQWCRSYQNYGVRPFPDVQPRLSIRVDVIFGDEALSRETQEDTRRTALTHLVSQHHYLNEGRARERERLKCQFELEAAT